MSLDLERATQARRQMTADIAHDLRSPLSVISGYSEALSDGKLPGTPETYNILYQETKHLSHLVEDLRLLSLADAGELSLILQPIDPRQILERVAARHAVKAQQKGISLRVEAVQDLPAVSMDGERISQVLDNLILNAFRYTPRGGEIILAAKPLNGAIQLQVRDNGGGIAPEDLPYIFDRFYRGDRSRQENGESGLGLAIAKSIVEAHGGMIAVESTPGQGTVFNITLKLNL
jgi:signal transduction histidine kinase